MCRSRGLCLQVEANTLVFEVDPNDITMYGLTLTLDSDSNIKL